MKGATYPKRVLADPKQPFAGCYVDTERKGWRRTQPAWASGIHWFTCARALFYRECQQIASKSDACRWCAETQPSEFGQLFRNAASQLLIRAADLSRRAA
ncbi:MAG: DUF4111 domain-containing protein [Firmicutes bacterium]|nr:DUF4111 domain-containing protein [Bacillota bacterium]